MDEAFAILLLIGVGAVVLFGPWILLWRSHRRRTAQRLEDQVRWAELTRRVHLLEQAVKPNVSPADIETSVPAKQPEIATPVPPPVPDEPVHIPQITRPTIEEPPPIVAPPPPVEEQLPPPEVTSAEPRPVASRLKSALDVEDKLGTNWLNKLGIGLLVLGIAFFLAYQLTNLGPAGKVLVGYMVSCCDARNRHLAGAQGSLPHPGARRRGRGMGAALLYYLRDVSRAGGARPQLTVG